ncbi:MAG: hypothetical protein A4E53_03850 [Pelotomaculum sp. PtaB.Bin104]|nr:MAG: hypothetical protein A4E53_03850 [Pelotomaculum sp. PtaB.Bin104]
MDGEMPLFAEFEVPGTVAGTDESFKVLDYTWPFDLFAFSFGFLNDPEIMKNFLVVFIMDKAIGRNSPANLNGTLEKIRTDRRYTLTPGGVKAILPRGEITGVRELVMEELNSKVFAVARVGEEISFPVWFDWRKDSVSLKELFLPFTVCCLVVLFTIIPAFLRLQERVFITGFLSGK